MPVSGAPLSGALNPLSSRTRKQRGKKKSFASSAAPHFSPDSLPASCGALAPSGCVHAANRSPLPGIRPPKPEPQLPAPSPRRESRQASRAGECWLAPILCAGISPLCPPHPCGCALLRGSEAYPSATRSLLPRRAFQVCGNLSSFTASSHWCTSHPYSLSLTFLFSFGLPRYVG